MTALAIALILLSAGLHASWNLLAKRLPGGGESVWLFALVAVIVYAPPAVVSLWYTGFRPDATAWLFLAGTGLFQLGYYTLLRRGYASGDLSVVYPLTRGTGPLTALVLAVIVIGERPSAITIAGAAIISIGAFLLVNPARLHHSSNLAGVWYGLATGVIIGCYTAWDGYAVGHLAIPALVYDWAGRIGLLIWLTPLASRRRAPMRHIWRSHWREVVGIGIFSTGTYVMVLFALTIAPISSIAPAREIGIVAATIMGMTLLHEPAGRQRIVAAIVITLGVLVVAFG